MPEGLVICAKRHIAASRNRAKGAVLRRVRALANVECNDLCGARDAVDDIGLQHCLKVVIAKS